MIPFAGGLLLLILGLIYHATGLAIIGIGMWFIGSMELLLDQSFRAVWQSMRPVLLLPYVRYSYWRDLSVLEEDVRPIIETYVRLHHNDLRAPYYVSADGRVMITPIRQDRGVAWGRHAVPQSIGDLSDLLATRGMTYIDDRNLWLYVNRAVWDSVRKDLEKTVFCKKDGYRESNLEDIFIRFARHNTQSTRQVFFEMMQEEFSVRLIAQCFGIRKRWVFTKKAARQVMFQALAIAMNESLSRQRQRHLEHELFATAPPNEYVAKLRSSNPETAMRYLQQVFSSRQVEACEIDPMLINNFFIVSFEDTPIVFHLGFTIGGEVGRTVIDRASANKAVYKADKVILLALGYISASVLSYADSIGVLVLTEEALEQLLADHESRAKEAISFTLVASEKNTAMGLELNVST